MDEELEQRIRCLEIKVENLEYYNDTFKEMFDKLYKLIDGIMKDRDREIKLLSLIESKTTANATQVDRLYKNLKGY